MNNSGNKKIWIIIAAAVVLIIVTAVVLTVTAKQKETLTYDELVQKVQDGKVSGIYFSGSYNVNVLYTEDLEKCESDEARETLMTKFENGKYSSATAIVPYRDTFIQLLDEYQSGTLDGSYDGITIVLNDPSKASFTDYIVPIIYVLMLIGIGVVIFITIRSGKGGNTALNFGKTKACKVSSVKVRFNDVAGADEEKEELKEVVEFLKSPKKFKEVGAKIPRGVLLVGNPGTGKTMFAKAVAGEAGVPFFSISGSDFVEMFVGVGASRVRDLFAQAKKEQPCIVFIDEIDAVGRKRGAGLGGGNDEREQTLNQLLVQMDGFEESDGIVVMAATNRVDVLDPALLRPGRFDRQIYVNMPDVKGREAIFRVHARNKPLSSDIDFKTLARLTTGFSGADIANLLNESAILAARDNRKVILMKDIQEGINKVVAGPQKKSRVVTERDKRITAYHEAGHAIVGRLMKNCDAVQEISIIPRGMAAGYTLSRPKTDDSHVTKGHLTDEIAMYLGGRAAEELVIQDISTGASQDLKQATATARSMVAEWGMSDALPNVFFGGEQEVFIGRDYQTQNPYSDEIAAIIDTEIRKIIDTNYARAKNALQTHMDALHNTVRLLFEHETIYGDELDMILAGKSVEEVTAYINSKSEEQRRMVRDTESDRYGVLGNPRSVIITEPKVKMETPDNEISVTVIAPKQDDATEDKSKDDDEQ